MSTARHHRWQSNEDVRVPASLARCLTCQVRRFSDDPATIARAEADCPGALGRTILVATCATCGSRCSTANALELDTFTHSNGVSSNHTATPAEGTIRAI